MAKPFNRDKWLLRPFRTPEGCVEVWLRDEVYGANIHLLTECTADQYNAWARRVFDKENPLLPDPDFHASAGWITSDKDRQRRAVIILFPGKWEPSIENFLTMGHECFHATSYILFSRGLQHTDATDEAFAYFHESLARRFILALGKRPLPYCARP